MPRSKSRVFIERAITVAFSAGIGGVLVAITIATAGLTACVVMLGVASVTDEDRDERLAAVVFGVDVFGAALVMFEPGDEITTWYGDAGMWLVAIAGAATLCYAGITLCYLGIMAILKHRRYRRDPA
ncbi:hypothetical protein [Nocardia sp. NPDC058705]|uniref:hypothetical protein n=1 Tax=Nocardia sp. NPDC058705 TaxID=3346609 RepID=UPI00368AD356